MHLMKSLSLTTVAIAAIVFSTSALGQLTATPAPPIVGDTVNTNSDPIPPEAKKAACSVASAFGWDVFMYMDIPASASSHSCYASNSLTNIVQFDQSVGGSTQASIATSVSFGGKSWTCLGSRNQSTNVTGSCSATDGSTTVIYGWNVANHSPSQLSLVMVAILDEVQNASGLQNYINIVSTAIRDAESLANIFNDQPTIKIGGTSYVVDNTVISALNNAVTIANFVQGDANTSADIYLTILKYKLFMEGWEQSPAVVSALQSAETEIANELVSISQAVAATIAPVARRISAFEMYVGRNQAEYEAYVAQKESSGGMPDNSAFCGGWALTLSQQFQVPDCDVAVMNPVIGLNNLRGAENPYQDENLDQNMQCSAYMATKCAVENN